MRAMPLSSMTRQGRCRRDDARPGWRRGPRGGWKGWGHVGGVDGVHRHHLGGRRRAATGQGWRTRSRRPTRRAVGAAGRVAAGPHCIDCGAGCQRLQRRGLVGLPGNWRSLSRLVERVTVPVPLVGSGNRAGGSAPGSGTLGCRHRSCCPQRWKQSDEGDGQALCTSRGLGSQRGPCGTDGPNPGAQSPDAEASSSTAGMDFPFMALLVQHCMDRLPSRATVRLGADGCAK